MTIDLVFSPSSSGSENYSSEAPVGPIAVYSSLSPSLRDNCRFLDGTISSQAEIEQAVTQRRATVVAVSCTTYNYPNALRIAEVAKQNGSCVVFGGIHITHMRDKILAKMARGNRPIDFLITGYGEPAFGPLLYALENGRVLNEIPNLSFIKDWQVIVNPLYSKRHRTDPLKVPMDYSGIDFQKYSEQFRPFGRLSSVRMPGSVFTQRGCVYTGNRKCTFCSIEQINAQRSPELFEQDVVTLIEKYQVDHIRIGDPNFTQNPRHMASLADAAERAFARTGVRPVFYCLARANEIDEQRILLLKRLNVLTVFIGYESGSDKMLKAMHKHTTKAQNLQATTLLKDHGIEVICGGLVLGAEGESEATVLETLEFAKELKKIGNTSSVMATPLIPLPGSSCFEQLLQQISKNDTTLYKHIGVADTFEISELIELWNRYNSKVPLNQLIEVCNEIAAMFPVGIRLIKWSDYDKSTEEIVSFPIRLTVAK